jgi:hypothetical protein
MKEIIGSRKTWIFIGSLLILLLMLPGIGTAQIDPPPENPPDPDVPISGLEILIALGGLFGVSRFFKGVKKES